MNEKKGSALSAVNTCRNLVNAMEDICRNHLYRACVEGANDGNLAALLGLVRELAPLIQRSKERLNEAIELEMDSMQ